MNKNNMPLSITLETAKSKLKSAFNEVLSESKLPAYLMEGIVLEILADIRNRKNIELMMDYSFIQSSQEEKIKREGKR